MIQPAMPAIAARQLKLAVLWLMIGLVLGMFMSASGDFALRGVHTHINLLGWATLALTGLVYAAAPAVAESRLAQWHFWLHNLGLPVMMGGLAFYLLKHEAAEPVLAAGSIITMLGLAVFAVNLFRRL